MEFQQLEMFAAVVELGTIQRAAERVFRTGPAVSIALRKLEEEVGAPLFTGSDRHHQELTASGQLLYSYCTRILGLKRQAIAGLEALTKCKTGHRSCRRKRKHQFVSPAQTGSRISGSTSKPNSGNYVR